MSSPSLPPPRSPALEVEALEDRCLLSTAGFVSTLYADLLHRAPAPAEAAGWVAALNTGVSPLAVAAAFTTSPEYETNLIRSDYQTLLGRPAAPSEVASWLGALQSGLSGFQFQAAFLGSAEFFARHGNNVKTWLNAVYHDVLDRPVDAAGLASWSQQLAAGVSRQTVALGILESSEALGRLVTATYQDLLKRDPAPGEVDQWVTALQAGLTPAQFLADVTASAEFIDLQGGLDLVQPVVVPVVVPVPVDTFFDPFLFPGAFGVAPGFTVGSTGGFTGGGFTGGGFTGGGSGT